MAETHVEELPVVLAGAGVVIAGAGGVAVVGEQGFAPGGVEVEVVVGEHDLRHAGGVVGLILLQPRQLAAGEGYP